MVRYRPTAIFPGCTRSDGRAKELKTCWWNTGKGVKALVLWYGFTPPRLVWNFAQCPRYTIRILWGAFSFVPHLSHKASLLTPIPASNWPGVHPLRPKAFVQCRCDWLAYLTDPSEYVSIKTQRVCKMSLRLSMGGLFMTSECGAIMPAPPNCYRPIWF